MVEIPQRKHDFLMHAFARLSQQRRRVVAAVPSTAVPANDQTSQEATYRDQQARLPEHKPIDSVGNMRLWKEEEVRESLWEMKWFRAN